MFRLTIVACKPELLETFAFRTVEAKHRCIRHSDDGALAQQRIVFDERTGHHSFRG
jgi:hypothetical protein